MDPETLALLRTAGLAEADCAALANPAGVTDRAALRGRLGVVLANTDGASLRGEGVALAVTAAIGALSDLDSQSLDALAASARAGTLPRPGTIPSSRPPAASSPDVPAARMVGRFGQATTPAEVAADAANALGSRGPGRTLLASIHAGMPEERRLRPGDAAANAALIAAAVSPRALVAAGGLCAPVEARYAVEGMGSTERPIRDALAGFEATRGGVTFTAPPTLSSVSAGVGAWTVADDESASTEGGPTKVILPIDCGDDVTVQVQAITERARFGNLAARFRPEYVQAVFDLLAVAQARMAELELLAAMRTLSTAVTAPAYVGAARDLLATAERAAVAYRSRHRLGDDAVLRVLLPTWCRGLMRSDLALSLPGDRRLEATDAELELWFTVRGLSPVWSLDAQPFGAQTTGVLSPWPSTVTFLVFAEGAFLHLDGGRLDLGIVRSPELNAVNDAESFAETFEGVARVGAESIAVTAGVRANGATAGTVAPAA